MSYYHEKIETNELIPARIYTGQETDLNMHYPMHWHNSLEFDLVLGGKVNVKIDGKSYDISAGDMFFANSRVLHETNASSKENFSTVTVLLSHKLLREYFPDVDMYYFDLESNKSAKNEIMDIVKKCGDLFTGNEEFYELKLSIELRKICEVLFTKCKIKRQNEIYSRYEQKSMEYIKKAITYLEKNYSSPITLNEISNEVGMSPNYFSRFFKKTTGETFYNYLTSIRVYYAYQDLANNDLSITEISLNNGFSNVKAFIETFKKEYKLTPAKYRKEMLAKD